MARAIGMLPSGFPRVRLWAKFNLRSNCRSISKIWRCVHLNKQFVKAAENIIVQVPLPIGNKPIGKMV